MLIITCRREYLFSRKIFLLLSAYESLSIWKSPIFSLTQELIIIWFVVRSIWRVGVSMREMKQDFLDLILSYFFLRRRFQSTLNSDKPTKMFLF